MKNATEVAITRTVSQTKEVAQQLAHLICAGDVILLTGDLGAGKTQFTQGLAEGLGCATDIISPTFNIVLSYEKATNARLVLHHFDLYRLDDESQLEDIGLREYLESDGVCVIEWAEKFPQAFSEYLHVMLEKVDDTTRRVCAHAQGTRSQELLDRWKVVASNPSALSLEAAEMMCSCREENTASGAITGAVAGVASGAVAGAASGAVAGAAIDSAIGVVSSRLSGCDASSGTSAGVTSESCTSAGGSGAAIANASDSGVAIACTSGTSKGATSNTSTSEKAPYVVAFDTANEVVALAVGRMDAATQTISVVAQQCIPAHRASNTTLLPALDALLVKQGIERCALACVCVGRGPGSFTGVRIAMAAAKGIAQALGVALVGVSTLDALAWRAFATGVRGRLLVIADAMRKEVYPAVFDVTDAGVSRAAADYVVKASDFAHQLASGAIVPAFGCSSAASDAPFSDALSSDVLSFDAPLQIAGDGLVKYEELFSPYGNVLEPEFWNVDGCGLLLSLQDAWQKAQVDPFDAQRHNPALVLPVYTRLSDAEENERAKKAAIQDEQPKKNLRTGVQDVGRNTTMHATAQLRARPDKNGIAVRPMHASDCVHVAALEKASLGTDAWSEHLFVDDLGQRSRTWWVAQKDEQLVGYAGALIVDGSAQLLKVVVDAAFRHQGIGKTLIACVAEDARNLGATDLLLEVRMSNETAHAFYRALGLQSIGERPHYYSDGEDALLMSGPLPVASCDVAGMELTHLDTTNKQAGVGAVGGTHSDLVKPLILAIESSCDETAAAVVEGTGTLRADIVASQVDFHARFGGVVPEIASRKHIEAICGVCDEALDVAGVDWRDLQAVAVTYAPGLVGALVVGVAYAKAAAWALDVPFIGVNHLEGHLYANKIGHPDFAPPAVVSLVSGGNTMLVHMKDWGVYEVLGATIDDAVGEAFDKVAKALGLGYPGGPAISRAAAKGNPAAIDFPRAMMYSHDLRFSLSGLKTAVVNYINNQRQAGHELVIPDIAASFQQAVVDVQVAKTRRALQQTGAPTFCLGGGVAANPVLRNAYEKLCADMGVRLILPPLSSCGDNAGMIALVALDRYQQQRFFDLDADAYAHADLSQIY